DAGPYREWAIALQDAGAYAAAREVLLAGRKALGPSAFAIELGELRARLGDWPGAARDWAAAIDAAPSQLANAAAQLGETPQSQRDPVVAALLSSDAV